MRYELPHSEDRPIWDIWLSMHNLPAMAVAEEVGLFSSLAERPMSAAELAQRLGFNRRATEVLLCMLRALGLLVSREGRYGLADIARSYLLADSPYYWGPLLRTFGMLPQQRAALIRALRASHDLPTAVTSTPLPSEAWANGKMTRAQAEEVSRIMHCHSLAAAVGAAASGCFADVERLLDVGGGSGCFSIAIAQRFKNARCTIMDLPVVCDVARRYIEEGGVGERVDTLGRDMFQAAWPLGYDGVLFSNVFHDWSPDTNRCLAGRAHEALESGGRIFLHEMLLADDGSGPITTASFSMLMLFGTQGRQYTLSELSGILVDAGFVDIDVRETHGYFSVVSGRKA